MRRKLFMLGLVGAIASLGFSSAVFAGALTSKEELAVSTTGGGIKIKSNNGNTFSIGGRIMYDYDSWEGAYNTFGDADSRNGDTGSESEFRRTRVNVAGTTGKNWAYKLTMDIDEGEAEIDTAYIKYKGFKNVGFAVGRLKAPAGLEELTSSKWIATIERSVATGLNILSGKPNFQAQAQAHSGNFFGQLALIDEGNEDNDRNDNFSYALRGGGHFPLGEDKHFIHAAASYASRDFGDSDGVVDFQTRGSVHTISSKVTVQGGKDFEVGDADQYGLELAYVNGPFSFQTEYWDAGFDGTANGAGDIANTDVDVSAYYLQLSYFLTGESRKYKGGIGAFNKVKPKGNRGAWEVVGKYEDGEIDPDNQASESEFELLTLGLNWYATNNVKFMFNYLDFSTDNFYGAGKIPLTSIGEEDGKAFSFRAQYAF